jgi:D-alanine-D-alanine ligase
MLMKIEPEKYGTVGVLLGGPSAEREISLKSGRAISRALRESGITVIEIGENEEIRDGVRAHDIDLAFIALHGRFGEDGQVQEFLEGLKIPYTGSGVSASRQAMDKILSYKVFKSEGLTTPEYRIIEPEDNLSSPPISLPVVVKPAREGSSIGLSLVREPGKFMEAITTARRHDERIIVDKYIPGRELTISILEDKALPVIEIIPDNPFFDYEAKYVKGRSEFIVPADLSKNVYREAQSIGLAAHRALGCYAYSRADILLGEDGGLYLLEVNSIPGFTATSLLPQAARAVGIDFPELCLKLLDLALARG